MIDIAVAYNRFRFLGKEFLTWLWFEVEKGDENTIILEIGNRIVLENTTGETLETIVITGDDAGLEEGMLALRKGALVAEINLIYRRQDQSWQFTIKGESLHLTQFKTPQTGPIETQQDFEAALLEKAYLFEQGFDLIDQLFKRFVQLRTSDTWQQRVVPDISQWIGIGVQK